MGDKPEDEHHLKLGTSTSLTPAIKPLGPSHITTVKLGQTSMTVAERMKKFEEAHGRPIAPKQSSNLSIRSTSGIPLPLPRNRSLEPRDENQSVIAASRTFRKTSVEPLKKDLLFGEVAQPDRNGITVTHGMPEIRSKLPVVSRPSVVTTTSSTAKSPRVLPSHASRLTVTSKIHAAENGVDDKMNGKRPSLEQRKSSSKSGTIDFHPLQARIREGTRERMQRAVREKTKLRSPERPSPTESIPDATKSAPSSSRPAFADIVIEILETEKESAGEENIVQSDVERAVQSLHEAADQNESHTIFTKTVVSEQEPVVPIEKSQTPQMIDIETNEVSNHLVTDIITSHQSGNAPVFLSTSNNLCIDTSTIVDQNKSISLPTDEEESPIQGKFQALDTPLSAITNSTEFDLEPQYEWNMVDSANCQKRAMSINDTLEDEKPVAAATGDANAATLVVEGLQLAAIALKRSGSSAQLETEKEETDSSKLPNAQSYCNDPGDEFYEEEAMGFQISGFDLASLHVPPHFDGNQDFSEASAAMFKRSSTLSNTSAHVNSSSTQQSSSYLEPNLQTNRSSYRSSWTDNSSHSTERSTESERPDCFNDPADITATAPLRLRTQSPKPAVPPKPFGYSPQPSPGINHRTSYASVETTQSSTDQSSIENRGRSVRDVHQYVDHGTSFAITSPGYPPPTPPMSNSYKSFHEPNQDPSLPSPQTNANQRIYIEPRGDGRALTNQSTLAWNVSDGPYHPGFSERQRYKNEPRLMSQDIVSDTLPEPSEADRARWFQRYSVIKELVDTEALYLKDMHVFHEIYKGTSEACSTLTSEDIALLFRNIDQIVRFTTLYLEELKAAAAPIYVTHRSKSKRQPREELSPVTKSSLSRDHESKDRGTRVAKAVLRNLDRMQLVYGEFLKHQAEASERLKELQSNPTVGLWLAECNKVAKELTAAWDIDSLWSKPLQRITKLPLTLRELQKQTPEDHPDYRYLQALIPQLMTVVETVNASAGESNASRKRAASVSNPKSRKALWKKLSEPRAVKDTKVLVDVEFNKVSNSNHNDFMRLQIIVRDIEEYLRTTSDFCAAFERCITCIEGVVLYVGKNVSSQFDWKVFSESVASFQSKNLPVHIDNVQRWVLDPLNELLKFFATIHAKTQKRFSLLASHEKYAMHQKSGKRIDDRLAKAEAEYQQLNTALKSELPTFASCLRRIVDQVQAKFISEQVEFVVQWQECVERFFGDPNAYYRDAIPEDFETIREMWKYRFEEMNRNLPLLKILERADGSMKRVSMGKSTSSNSIVRQSTSNHIIKAAGPLSPRSRGHSTITLNGSTRSRGQSFTTNDEAKDSLPRTVSDGGDLLYRGSDLAINTLDRTRRRASDRDLDGFVHSRTIYSARPASSTSASGSAGSSLWLHGSQRPQTGRSSGSHQRQNVANYELAEHDDWGARINESFGLFNSAMPLEDTLREPVRKSSTVSQTAQTSSSLAERDIQQHSRIPTKTLYMAASLFEFNIDGVKTEAGYPYLTYPAGDIFDVIAEKGELWLAKNNEDPKNRIGWIWSKHFARFASLDDNEAPKGEGD